VKDERREEKKKRERKGDDLNKFHSAREAGQEERGE